MLTYSTSHPLLISERRVSVYTQRSNIPGHRGWGWNFCCYFKANSKTRAGFRGDRISCWLGRCSPWLLVLQCQCRWISSWNYIHLRSHQVEITYFQVLNYETFANVRFSLLGHNLHLINFTRISLHPFGSCALAYFNISSSIYNFFCVLGAKSWSPISVLAKQICL